jgi:propionyl-CoA synthetase
MATHRDVHRRSLEDPEGFWRAASQAIDWFRPPATVLDETRPPFTRWFPDGELNTCHNALDRHVTAGRGEQVAIIYDSPVTGVVQAITYAQLQARVARFAGVLAGLGVARGDRVVIYMPMVPEVVVAMLACARIGAIHSVVFGGFAARELAVRIDDATPKVVVAASCGLEAQRVIEYLPLLDRALALAEHTVEACVVLQRPQARAVLTPGRDHDWHELVAAAAPVDCVPVAATDPLYILYTSGTTGRPKGVVRDNGGHAVALRWSMEAVYDLHPGEVFWAASDVGWVVGHSYIVYAPLLTGCTSVLYEGKPVGTPDPGAFWRVIAEHRVKALFTAPTAIRAIKKEDPSGSCALHHDLSGLRALFLAGERLDPDTYQWAHDLLGRPVIDHWWQTETGWPIVANCLGLGSLPVKPGSPTLPVPGWDVVILDADNREVPRGVEGAVMLRRPLPPGAMTTLWGDDERFASAYFSRSPDHCLTGDGGSIDEDGYVYIMGRIDDVINVAGHRLSTGTMEGVLSQHPAVAECAVFGIADDLKGQVPMGLVVLKGGVELDHADLAQQLVQLVRNEIGPVAAFKRVHVVPRLPKTRSGKILRRTMRAIVDGACYEMPATIDDPAILGELERLLRDHDGGVRGGAWRGAPAERPQRASEEHGHLE